MFNFFEMRRKNKLFARILRMQANIWAVMESAQFLAETPEVKDMHDIAIRLMELVVTARESLLTGDTRLVVELEKRVQEFMELFHNYDVTVLQRVYYIK